MSISALRICLVIIFSLLGLIDGGTCSFPNVEDTLEHACDDFRSLSVARYTGTQTLAGDEDELPVSEIDGGKPKPLNLYSCNPKPPIGVPFDGNINHQSSNSDRLKNNFPVISKETIKEGAGLSDLIKQRGEKAFPSELKHPHDHN
ncbi:hypothetical protein KEM48_004345 [Puccinia striiformis f. sp. tritici PST-130]|nr:hypothetical protein KEM48_004345 [Puccinia striiformis f. sp. tritici PST-130]